MSREAFKFNFFLSSRQRNLHFCRLMAQSQKAIIRRAKKSWISIFFVQLWLRVQQTNKAGGFRSDYIDEMRNQIVIFATCSKILRQNKILLIQFWCLLAINESMQRLLSFSRLFAATDEANNQLKCFATCHWLRCWWYSHCCDVC